MRTPAKNIPRCTWCPCHNSKLGKAYAHNTPCCRYMNGYVTCRHKADPGTCLKCRVTSWDIFEAKLLGLLCGVVVGLLVGALIYSFFNLCG